MADQCDVFLVFYLQVCGVLIWVGENVVELDEYWISLDDVAVDQGCQFEYVQLIYQCVNEGYVGFECLMWMSFLVDQFSWEVNVFIGLFQIEWLVCQDVVLVVVGLVLVSGELEFVVDLFQVDGVMFVVFVLCDMVCELDFYDLIVGGFYLVFWYVFWLCWSVLDYVC